MMALYYFLMGIFIILFELIRPKRWKFDFLSMINLKIFLLYPLSGFVLNYDFVRFASRDAKYVGADRLGTLSAAMGISWGYLFVLLGYYFYKPGKLARITFSHHKSIGFYTTLAFIGILLSISFIYIYSLQYGGFISALQLSDAIRSAAIDPGPFSFMKRLFPLVELCSYLIFSLLFVGRVQKFRGILYAFFGISIILTFLTLVMRAGRLNFIEYALTFYLLWVMHKKKLYLKYLIFIFPLAIIVILFGDQFFSSLRPGAPDLDLNLFLSGETGSDEDKGWLAEIFKNFYFAYISLEVAFQVALTQQHHLRFFMDVIYGFFSLLPEIFLGIHVPDTIAYFNTEYITGVYESLIPPGIFAFGIYSMWWPGLFIVSFILGYLVRLLQEFSFNNLHLSFWGPLIFVLFLFLAGKLIAGEPRVFFQSSIIKMLACIYLILVERDKTYQGKIL